MTLDSSWMSFNVQCWPNKHFQQFDRSSAAHLHQDVLFCDFGHFFLLLLALVDCLLHVGDPLANSVEAVSMARATERQSDRATCD